MSSGGSGNRSVRDLLRASPRRGNDATLGPDARKALPVNERRERYLPPNAWYHILNTIALIAIGRSPVAIIVGAHSEHDIMR